VHPDSATIIESNLDTLLVHQTTTRREHLLPSKQRHPVYPVACHFSSNHTACIGSKSTSNMSSPEESSFLLASNPSLEQPGIEEEVDSLPSSSDTDSTISDSDEYHSDAEKQWRESLQQLELLLTMVVVPYMGKYFGRKAAYWGELCCN
jgi:hypothetical protein